MIDVGPDRGLASSPKGIRASPTSSPGSPILAPAPPQSDNQICYEVRFVELNGEPWDELRGDQPRQVVQGTGVAGWMVAAADLDAFLKRIEKRDRAKVLRAPKVTAFENGTATIFTNEQCLSAVMEKKAPRALASHNASRVGTPQKPQPAAKNPTGSVVEVSGSLRPGGIHLSADVHDVSITTVDTTGKPAVVDWRCRVSCEVSTGACLAISLGVSDDKAKAPEARSSLTASIGPDRAAARSSASERLVLITPRAILTEAEQHTSPVIKGSFEGNKSLTRSALVA